MNYHANRGVKRNKKKRQNLVYRFEEVKVKLGVESTPEREKYRFKDGNFYYFYWKYQRSQYENCQLLVTRERAKELLGLRQWKKFGEGKRIFIIQRRENKHNL